MFKKLSIAVHSPMIKKKNYFGQESDILPPDTAGFATTEQYSGLYCTGICESSFSKRTLINALTLLKDAVKKEGYTVSGETVTPYSFDEVMNLKGCVYIRGRRAGGKTLYDLYREFKPDTSFYGTYMDILKIIQAILNAALAVQRHTGSYPPLLLNSIYFDDTSGSITFLPFSVIDSINRHHGEQLQAILYTCCADGDINDGDINDGDTNTSRSISSTQENIHEKAFNWGAACLIYLFFTSGEPIQNIYIYLQNIIPDIPCTLADAVWNILRKKTNVSLKPINESIESVPGTDEGYRIPLFKRKSTTFLLHKMGNFLMHRWKLIAICMICAGIGFYLISDLVSGSKKPDITAGLTPREVVELYYSATEDLNLDVIDSLFYKKAGKRIKDELSTLYVMLRMEQAYGEKLVKPDENLDNSKVPQGYKVFGIKDLKIESRGTLDNPVFFTTYTRVLSSEGTMYESGIEETIYLQKINERWYITKSVRTIVSSTQPQ